MQIVINISDEKYGYAVENQFLYLSGERLGTIIANGIPLPKGHGRLIDADVFKTAFPCGESVKTECVRATIDYAPTIIESDKAESEDKE